MEKVDDALATKDRKGVGIAEVLRAKTALSADRVGQARSLLQHSILGATASLAPAVGEQTGTTVVRLPMAGRGPPGPTQWMLGLFSLLVFLAGLALAFWFRPQDNLTRLRRLGTNKPVYSHDTPTGQIL